MHFNSVKKKYILLIDISNTVDIKMKFTYHKHTTLKLPTVIPCVLHSHLLQYN